MNSREKGKRGERQWRDELRANGYNARRGQQFCGSHDSPDVVCADLGWIHFEVKAVEKLNIWDAMDQARQDTSVSANSKVPIVAHKRNFRPWLVTMEAETFFRLLRGALPCHGTDADAGGAASLPTENWSVPHPCPLPEGAGSGPRGAASLPKNLHQQQGAAGESQNKQQIESKQTNEDQS